MAIIHVEECFFECLKEGCVEQGYEVRATPSNGTPLISEVSVTRINGTLYVIVGGY